MKKIKICQCGRKKYGYRDDDNKFWLCFACGKFEGKADNSLMTKILFQPELLLDMIQTKKILPFD